MTTWQYLLLCAEICTPTFRLETEDLVTDSWGNRLIHFGHLIQPACSSRTTYSHLPRTMSIWSSVPPGDRPCHPLPNAMGKQQISRKKEKDTFKKLSSWWSLCCVKEMYSSPCLMFWTANDYAKTCCLQFFPEAFLAGVDVTGFWGLLFVLGAFFFIVGYFQTSQKNSAATRSG